MLTELTTTMVTMSNEIRELKGSVNGQQAQMAGEGTWTFRDKEGFVGMETQANDQAMQQQGISTGQTKADQAVASSAEQTGQLTIASGQPNIKSGQPSNALAQLITAIETTPQTARGGAEDQLSLKVTIYPI